MPAETIPAIITALEGEFKAFYPKRKKRVRRPWDPKPAVPDTTTVADSAKEREQLHAAIKKYIATLANLTQDPAHIPIIIPWLMELNTQDFVEIIHRLQQAGFEDGLKTWLLPVSSHGVGEDAFKKSDDINTKCFRLRLSFANMFLKQQEISNNSAQVYGALNCVVVDFLNQFGAPEESSMMAFLNMAVSARVLLKTQQKMTDFSLQQPMRTDILSHADMIDKFKNTSNALQMVQQLMPPEQDRPELGETLIQGVADPTSIQIQAAMHKDKPAQDADMTRAASATQAYLNEILQLGKVNAELKQTWLKDINTDQVSSWTSFDGSTTFHTILEDANALCQNVCNKLYVDNFLSECQALKPHISQLHTDLNIVDSRSLWQQFSDWVSRIAAFVYRHVSDPDHPLNIAECEYHLRQAQTQFCSALEVCIQHADSFERAVEGVFVPSSSAISSEIARSHPKHPAAIAVNTHTGSAYHQAVRGPKQASTAHPNRYAGSAIDPDI